MENEQRPRKKRRTEEDEQLLLCAKKLHKACKDIKKKNILWTRIFSEDELSEGKKLRCIQKRLKETFIPQVQHMEDPPRKLTLTRVDFVADVQIVVDYLIREENESKGKMYYVSNCCDFMNEKIQCYANAPSSVTVDFLRKERKKKLRKLPKETEEENSGSQGLQQQPSAPGQRLTTPKAPTVPCYVLPTVRKVDRKLAMKTCTLVTAKELPVHATAQATDKAMVSKSPGLSSHLSTEAAGFLAMQPTPTPEINAQLRGMTPHNISYRFNTCIGCLSGSSVKHMDFFVESYIREGFQGDDVSANPFEERQMNGLSYRIDGSDDQRGLVVRSLQCSSIVDFGATKRDHLTPKRCCACQDETNRVQKMYERFATRVVARSHAENGSKPSKHTRHDIVAQDPQLGAARLREMSKTIRHFKRRERIAKLVEKSGVFVNDKKADALKVAMDTINRHFERQIEDGTISESDKAKHSFMKDMHAHTVRYMLNCGKRSRGFRCPPIVANFCVQMCIKLGQRSYEQLADVFGWPTLRQVQQLKKDIAGKTQLTPDGLCAQSMLSMKERAEQWAPNERLVALSHDSTMLSDGVMTDFNNEIVNIDLTQPFDIVDKKFHEMATKQSDSSSDEELDNLSGSLEEHMPNVAKHHMVAIATIVSPMHTLSLVVGCINVTDLDAGSLSEFLGSIVTYLTISGFKVVIETGDGAGENCAMWRDWSRLKISPFIPSDLRDKFSNINFEPEQIGCYPNPLTRDPIILMQDMPHQAKRMCHNLENSSFKDKRRDLKHGINQPANFNMIRCVYRNMIQGNEHGLNPTKLTNGHFEKTPMSRMKVQLAVQVMSKSTHGMLMDARTTMDSDEFKKAFGLFPGQYEFLCGYIIQMDRFVDIINGRGKDGKNNPFTPENGREIQEELLGILSFFSKWKIENDANKDMDEYNYLADATWTGLQQIVLGYVVLIEVYCIRDGATINPRRTTSDKCEHYFARARGSFGSTDTGTAQQFNEALRNQSVLALAKVSSSSNNARCRSD